MCSYPAPATDGKLKVSGRVADVKEITELIGGN
ncbi:thioredoxin family protein [Methanoplanus endosymbiosus]|uniref:Thioredoxin family protein n=1 Tax=Methanoplanus endosymbiosus TaxID=33865 RepID=A0A9E7PQQ6_9EURY|nr:thioredoxin family protein [Methanoplanus endosymbiosus]UUX93206.1 thioredoxin family protein [Methanoplanus endosymbiosus]